MNIYSIKDLPVDELETLLRGESSGIEEMAYNRPLSEEELVVRKDELSKNTILLDVINDELKEAKRQFKDKMEPITAKIKEDLKAIRNKSVEIRGKVYKMPDYENKMIHMVDERGHVITSRKMLPEEKQFTISSQISKSA
jgi:hypothetical protein